jgi:hypothetical protein
MLAAMSTDAATEAVEHVKNLAWERREAFDPPELSDDLARIGEPRFATLLGAGHACVPAPVLRLTANPRPAPSVAVGVGPRQLRRHPGCLVIGASLGGSPISGPLAGEAARGEQLQQQRRI